MNQPTPLVAGSPPPMGMPTFPCKTCRWASSAVPARARVAVWPSATRSSTWTRRWPPGCSRCRRRSRRSHPRRRAERLLRPRQAGPRGAAPAPAGAARRRRRGAPGTAPSGRRVPNAPTGQDRRLHRLLRRHPPCRERRQAVPPGQPTAAQLQARAHRLPRPRLDRARLRQRSAPAQRPDPAGRRQRAGVRPLRAPGLRTGAGHLDRPGQRPRRSHPGFPRRRAHRRLLPAQRLVGARHPGLGIPTARPVPVEELHHQRLALGGHRRSPGAVPPCPASAPRRRPAAAAVSLRRQRPGPRRLRHRAGGPAAHRGPARERPAAAAPDPEQQPEHVLDGGADGRPPQRQWLPVAARRPVRLRHPVRRRARPVRLAAGDHRWRQAAGATGLRRDPALPRGRRRGHPPRSLQARGTCLDRFRRMSRQGARGSSGARG